MKKISWLDEKFIRFLIVGVINTLVGTGVMFLLFNCLNQNYWVSSAANYVVGGIVSFFLNKYFTFQAKERSVGQVVRFILTVAVCYFIAYGAAKPLVKLILSGASEKVRGNLSMLVGMGLYTLLNYFGQRFFAFRSPQKADDNSQKEPPHHD